MNFGGSIQKLWLHIIYYYLLIHRRLNKIMNYNESLTPFIFKVLNSMLHLKMRLLLHHKYLTIMTNKYTDA